MTLVSDFNTCTSNNIILYVQSCLTLCNPIDCSPPGSSVHGILQARILGWVAIPFCKWSSWPRDRTWVSCIAGRLINVWDTREAQLLWEQRSNLNLLLVSLSHSALSQRIDLILQMSTPKGKNYQCFSGVQANMCILLSLGWELLSLSFLHH